VAELNNGIYNPFSAPKKQKKDFQASIGDRPLNTEYREEGPGNVRLDGGGYIVILQNTKIDAIASRLGAVMQDIDAQDRDGLGRHGICLLPPGKTENTFWKACASAAPTVMNLPTPHGTIRLCAEEQNEDEAFERIGRAFAQLPVKQILIRHHINVVVRGC